MLLPDHEDSPAPKFIAYAPSQYKSATIQDLMLGCPPLPTNYRAPRWIFLASFRDKDWDLGNARFPADYGTLLKDLDLDKDIWVIPAMTTAEAHRHCEHGREAATGWQIITLPLQQHKRRQLLAVMTSPLDTVQDVLEEVAQFLDPLSPSRALQSDELGLFQHRTQLTDACWALTGLPSTTSPQTSLMVSAHDTPGNAPSAMDCAPPPPKKAKGGPHGKPPSSLPAHRRTLVLSSTPEAATSRGLWHNGHTPKQPLDHPLPGDTIMLSRRGDNATWEQLRAEGKTVCSTRLFFALFHHRLWDHLGAEAMLTHAASLTVGDQRLPTADQHTPNFEEKDGTRPSDRNGAEAIRPDGANGTVRPQTGRLTDFTEERTYYDLLLQPADGVAEWFRTEGLPDIQGHAHTLQGTMNTMARNSITGTQGIIVDIRKQVCPDQWALRLDAKIAGRTYSILVDPDDLATHDTTRFLPGRHVPIPGRFGNEPTMPEDHYCLPMPAKHHSRNSVLRHRQPAWAAAAADMHDRLRGEPTQSLHNDYRHGNRPLLETGLTPEPVTTSWGHAFIVWNYGHNKHNELAGPGPMPATTERLTQSAAFTIGFPLSLGWTAAAEHQALSPDSMQTLDFETTDMTQETLLTKLQKLVQQNRQRHETTSTLSTQCLCVRQKTSSSRADMTHDPRCPWFNTNKQKCLLILHQPFKHCTWDITRRFLTIAMPAGTIPMTHRIREDHSPQLGQHKGFIHNCPATDLSATARHMDMPKTLSQPHYLSVTTTKQPRTLLLDSQIHLLPGCGIHRNLAHANPLPHRHTELCGTGNQVHTCLFVSLLQNLQHYDPDIYQDWNIQTLKTKMAEWINANLEREIEFGITVRAWITWTQTRHEHHSTALTCTRQTDEPHDVAEANVTLLKQYNYARSGIWDQAILTEPIAVTRLSEEDNSIVETHLCTCAYVQDGLGQRGAKLVTCTLHANHFICLNTYDTPVSMRPFTPDITDPQSTNWYKLHTTPSPLVAQDGIQAYVHRLLLADFKGGDIELILASHWLKMPMEVFSDCDATVTWGDSIVQGAHARKFQFTFSHARWDPSDSSQHWSARLPPTPQKGRSSCRTMTTAMDRGLWLDYQYREVRLYGYREHSALERKFNP